MFQISSSVCVSPHVLFPFAAMEQCLQWRLLLAEGKGELLGAAEGVIAHCGLEGGTPDVLLLSFSFPLCQIGVML